MFNKVILSGNLTRDPEQRFMPNGNAVCKFGLAVNRKWKDAGGHAQESVLFIDVNAFGKTAETITQYFRKGSRMLLEGRLQLEEWEDKQTQQKRSKISVVLEGFTFLDAANGGQQRLKSPVPGKTQYDPMSAPAEDDDSGVPF